METQEATQGVKLPSRGLLAELPVIWVGIFGCHTESVQQQRRMETSNWSISFVPFGMGGPNGESQAKTRISFVTVSVFSIPVRKPEPKTLALVDFGDDSLFRRCRF